MSALSHIKYRAREIQTDLEMDPPSVDAAKRIAAEIEEKAANSETARNRQDKGDKNELKAQKILNSMHQMRCEKVMQRSGDEYDYLGLADLLGLNRSNGDLWLIQVKTNSGYSRHDMLQFAFNARLHLDPGQHHFEVWDRIDRQGWEIHRWVRHMQPDEQGYFLDERCGGMKLVNDIDVMNDPGAIADIIADSRDSLKRGSVHTSYRKSSIINEKDLYEVQRKLNMLKRSDMSWDEIQEEVKEDSGGSI